MPRYIATKEDVMKQAPIQWKKISDYLRLGITWKDFLRKMEQYAKKKKMKFMGFSVGLKYERGWRAKMFENPKEKWVDMTLQFSPVVKSREAFEHVCSHELFHFYQNLYLCIEYPNRLTDSFKEACADVVSIRMVGSKKYQKEYPNKNYYRNSLIMAFAEQMNDLSRDELIELVTFPKTRKDLKPLLKKMMELLNKADHVKWIKKMEKEFRKWR